MGECVRDTCGRVFAIFFQFDYYLLACPIYVSFFLFSFFTPVIFFFLNTVLVSRVGLLLYCLVCV